MTTHVPQHILDLIEFSTLKRDEESPFPVPVGLKPQTKPCEDCDKTVTNRVVEIRQFAYPEKHWRQRCTNCKRFRDPYTGEFSLTDRASLPVFRRYLKERNK